MTGQEARNDEREALALIIARTMGGWSDDTTEPEMGDPLIRRMAEEHWEKVNDECLRQGREYADAVLASGYRKRPEPEAVEAGRPWPWVEAVNRALSQYDMGLLDVHGVAETLARKHPEPEITEARIDMIADAAEAALDAETHDDLCACAPYPDSCVTYGPRRPWSHSDPGRWTRAVLEAALRVPVGEGEQ